MRTKLILLCFSLFIMNFTYLIANLKAPEGLGLDKKGQLEGFISGVKGFSYYYAYCEAISQSPKSEDKMRPVVETAKRLVKENRTFKKNLDDLIAAYPKNKLFSKILTRITFWKNKTGFEKGLRDLDITNPQKIMNQLKIADGEIEIPDFSGLDNFVDEYQFVIDNFLNN